MRRHRAACSGPAIHEQRIAVQPVVELVAQSFLPPQVWVPAVDIIDPAASRLVVLGDHPRVAIILVHPPGHDRPGVRPRGRPSLPAAVIHRSEIRIASVVRLRVTNVRHPLAEETCHVAIENRSLRKSLNIAHPTCPLVALRAVGGNAVHVAPLYPLDHVHDLVDLVARALKRTGIGRIGMEHASHHIVGFGGVRRHIIAGL